MTRSGSAALAGFILALAARLLVVVLAPWNFSFDGYQRWAGRDHLLIHDWLPATQSVLWLVDAMGGGVGAARVALSVVAAAAVAAGVRLAGAMGGPTAAWCFVPFAVFAPFLTWSTVPYQEGTFLLLVFGAMAGALSGRLLLADLLAGAVALVRYEGWPFVAVYVVWRRDPRALRALWGAGLWLTLKALFDLTGHAPSPTDFADWNGISDRFTAAGLVESLQKMAGQAWLTGAWLVVLAGVAGMVEALKERRRGAVVLALLVAGQVAAIAGWLVGLETAIVRMQVVLCMFLGVFSATGAAKLWDAGRFRPLLVVVGLAAVSGWTYTGVYLAQRSIRSVHWEQALAEEWAAHPDRRWLVRPRKGLGTRSRHDGCEILQGITSAVHGEDFYCVPWLDGQAPPEGLWQAQWRKKQGYEISPPQPE